MEIQDGRAVKDFHDLKVWQKAHQLTLSGLSGHGRLSARRTVRAHQSTAAMQFFDTGQLGGGMRKKRRCRVRALLLDRYGIGKRVGVSPAVSQGSEAHQAETLRGLVTARNGAETHADRADAKADR